LREEQRGAPSLLAEGLTEWFQGKDTSGAQAASENVAELLLVWRRQNVKE
jgi:hypothetical protein